MSPLALKWDELMRPTIEFWIDGKQYSDEYSEHIQCPRVGEKVSFGAEEFYSVRDVLHFPLMRVTTVHLVRMEKDG